MPRANKERSQIVEMFESNQSARSDMRSLLRMREDPRLLQVLAADLDVFAAPDPPRASLSAVATATNLDVDVIRSIINVVDWLNRTIDNLDIPIGTLVRDLAEARVIESDNIEDVRKFLGEVFEIFSPAYLRRSSVAAIMRTFTGVEFACDFRLSDDAAHKEPAPVCVVRLRFDEGEPFVFQCMSIDLTRMIEAFQDAKRLLSSPPSKTA